MVTQRAVAVAVLVFAALAGTAEAQPPTPAGPNRTVADCMDVTRPAEFQPGGNLDPGGEPREPGLISPNSMVNAAVRCAQEFANGTMVPIGWRMFTMLAVIITIWTGVRMMFSGGFDFMEVVSLVFLIAFPMSVLSWYAATTNTPWGNFSFVTLVSGMGQVVGRQLVAGVWNLTSGTISETWEMIWASQAASRGGLVRWIDPATWVYEGLQFFSNSLQSLQFVLLLLVVGLLLIIPVVVAYCSYLWGYLALAVATVMGPVLIPWVLIPQLQFLAWGWFRAVLGAGVHMMVAGAIFSVVAQIMMIPVVRFGTLASNHEAVAETPLGPLAAVGESLPLILVAYLGAFKTSEITAMIMNGGSMPASGLGERVGALQTMGRFRGTFGGGRGAGAGAAAAAGKLGGPKAAVAAGAAKVLSQSTK